MKKLALVLAVLVLALSVVGCGKGGSGVAGNTYAFKTIEGEGLEELEEMGIDYAEMMKGTELAFDKNGGVVFTVAAFGQSETEEGTYTQDGNKVSITIEGDTQVAEVSGKKLTLESDGMKMIFEKK